MGAGFTAGPASRSGATIKLSAGLRYEVKGFPGEGGWTRVYLAHDTKLDSDVAFALIEAEGLVA